MYELIRITENNYYINSPTKVGVYQSAPGQVWLIDSGSDKDAARKIWKHIIEQSWTVQGILVTHSNADHMGGCQLLMQRAGCRVYARGQERAFVENTVFEPNMLYGGYPPKALRNKFLMAASVPCQDVSEAPLPPGLEIVPLRGHFLDMFGVITPEGVFYCADAVFSQAVVEKYHVNFVYDVDAALQCLEALPGHPVKWFLPAHAELTEDIGPLAKLNRDKLLEILALLEQLCESPVCYEDILKGLFDHFELTMNFSQYVLVGSSIRSCLSYLLDAGRLETLFADNKMLWKRL